MSRNETELVDLCKRIRRELPPAGYARQLLSAQLKMPKDQIPLRLIELKQAQLWAKQAGKQLTEIIGIQNGK